MECVDADSLHLQFVDKTLVEWITLSVSREENSSGLFIGIVYFISLNADCMPLILFFILFFFSSVITFPHPASFPLYLPVSPKHHSHPYNLILQKECSQSCHRELHTLFCLFCALIYQKCFSVFSHLQWTFSCLKGRCMAISSPIPPCSAVFPSPPLHLHPISHRQHCWK